MHLVDSNCLGSSTDAPAEAGKALCFSASYWVIGLEDGSVNVLGSEGLKFQAEASDQPDKRRRLSLIALVDNKSLVTAWVGDRGLVNYDIKSGYESLFHEISGLPLPL